MSGDLVLLAELPDEEATVDLAERLAPLLAAGDLLILSGDLGAGKTFFSGALCRALGLDADEPVTSPTFTLVHEYGTEPPVAHADVYRLKSAAEVRELGLLERRDEGWLVLVEWGEPYVDDLGGDALELVLESFPRRAWGRARGPRGLALLNELGEEAEA
ncbi:MAG TPA: tRNA (adenosine(37)-N6)-threonylcarbamoyltransferase complex ATPase subunit type 1 TsaE [Polyangiaceae bacterium]|nr:tRNA (adenosine(37)-N6)-threonylcarbamoyltransferase complex ATPase subunit type 1 TsaE [Polyangiaceae bacterium]